MTADHYLREKCGPDTAAFYAVLFAPRAKRAALRAIHVWWRELRELVEEDRDPIVAQTRLEWWRAEIDRTVAGSPRHPVTRTLAHAVAAGTITADDMTTAFDAITGAVVPPVIATFDDLSLHCERSAAPFLTMIGNLLDVDISRDGHMAAQLAVALELSRLITMLGADTPRRAQLVPTELSNRFDRKRADRCRRCWNTLPPRPMNIIGARRPLFPAVIAVVPDRCSSTPQSSVRCLRRLRPTTIRYCVARPACRHSGC